jgi:hypothetical protein
MPAIEKTDHEYHIECEAIEAGARRCPECGETGPRGLLFVYSSVRGTRIRPHEGAFCSLFCHDVFYGLHPRSR